MKRFNNLKEALRTNINENYANNGNFSTTDEAKKGYIPEKITYEDWGFGKAGNLNGSNTGLLSCLALLREHHRKMEKENINEQERRKAPLQAQIKSYEELISDKQGKIRNIENNILPQKEEKVNRLKNEISWIRKNPKSIMPDKLSKIGLIIGTIILVALTIYLFVFYSSASYSAFFKEFTLNEIGIANSIFDSKAITKAYYDGVTELILILFMPFIFIGLGFLIHQFQKGEGYKKYIQIPALILVTFLFDVILAFEITQKIYNIKAGNSFKDMPTYDFSLAFQSVNFWLIIFAGFIVYIIWGFVFDFTIESYDKLDVIKQEIKSREKEISITENDLDDKKAEIGILYDEISNTKKKIKELQGKINGVIIDTTEFDKTIQEFLGGWLHWMSANKFSGDKIDLAKQKTDDFISVNIKQYSTTNMR